MREASSWRPAPQLASELDELTQRQKKTVPATGKIITSNKATWVVVSFIAVTATVFAIFVMSSAPKHQPQHWFASFVAFGLPFGFLALAVWVARPWSVAYFIAYITLIVATLFMLPFVLEGYFEGQKIILLLIPIVALWGGSVLALIASAFQRRA